ncbi:hypothetical protein HANVADRAFT_53127 [Hanseniaspora valbyensis NRRL Y-1626]|uniref:Uncharacterized protein n=1 Tax=Hanseniaspora valbyensis NRRL Y-1626 TaxID=766949 RepID=A0A1B7TCE4_9ASCO|nr:hypothetical protein HANVADRAFT_53127 [Hanseniaspora valbyensis NRRL Y-1626]
MAVEAIMRVFLSRKDMLKMLGFIKEKLPFFRKKEKTKRRYIFFSGIVKYFL